MSVIDLKTGKQTAEAPTPGCWTIIPALTDARFSALCGDGTLLTVKLSGSGRPLGQTYSSKLFDADKDPLFTHVERVKGGDLIFVSYSGVLYRISDRDEKAVLVDTFKIASDGPGAWAPGGYALLAYNAANDVMFVLMHDEAEDGSHKKASDEVWAVDLAAKRVLYRSPAKGFTHLAVSQEPTPVLFAVSRREGKIVRFAVDPTAKFAAKPTHTMGAPEAGYLAAP